jgi:surfeit locus 1 family protein
VSIKIGSRAFAPRLFTTLVTLVLLLFLVSLGRWQLQRAADKRVLYDSFAAGTDNTRPIDSTTPGLPRYQHVVLAGHYDASRQVLIDNMVSAERAGYFVITPFELDDGGWILVNRGWVPLGPTRADKPAIPVADDERRIRGRADNLPAPGIQMGTRTALGGPYPVVASFPNHAEIAALLAEPKWAGAADLILLDAGEPDGYVRNWMPPGMPPLRHIGYAVQWFGLAVALLVIYFVVNTRPIQPLPEPLP